jgi:hypothetical protein
MNPNYNEEKPPAYASQASTYPKNSPSQVNSQNVNRWNDVESQNPPPQQGSATNDQWGNFGSGLTDKVVRLRFIRKVYSIVTIQLVFTFGIVLIFTAVDAIRDWMTKTTGGLVLYILA